MKQMWLQKYEFTVFGPNDDWSDWHGSSGVYIFAKDAGDSWRAVYVGLTSDFKNRPRIPSHSEWKEAEKKGATHVHLMKSTDPDPLEEELIGTLNPPLNSHHRTDT